MASNKIHFIIKPLSTVHYQAISHTDNQHLQLFLGSNKLRKITKN